MSYAIIRNTNYKMKNLSGIYRHNERKNTNYSNKDINKQNSILNYSIKAPYSTYEKVFKDMRTKYNLQGMIKKVSNVMCEFIITSDKEFFNSIGEKETKRYFETAYKFVANYNNLGEDFIISAKVHLDESTPHLHIVFVPVVHKKDKEGKEINKIACSEYWKGKDSYRKLQDNFYKYMIKSGFDLERGNTIGNEHIPTETLKKVTNYEMQEMFKESKHQEQEIITSDINVIRNEYKRVIKKLNTISSRYTRVKNIVEDTINKSEQVEIENYNLKQENTRLKAENSKLKNYINKTFEYVSILFDFSKERLIRLVNDFIYKLNIKDR
ncbi:MAG: MobV family relaxase [Clostridia bacterium]